MEKADGRRLWTRTFTALLAANFFTAMVFYLLNTTIAGHVMDSFHVGAAESGVIVGAYAVGSVFARVLIGSSADRLGLRRLTWSSTALYLVLTALYLVVDRYWLLFLVRLLQGISFGVSNTVVNTLGMLEIPPERRGEGTAVFTLSPTLSAAVGPAVGMVLARGGSYRAVLWTCVACAAVSMVMVLAAGIRPDAPPRLARDRAGGERRAFELFEASALPVSVMFLLMAMCYGTVTSFVSRYSESIGLADAATFYFVVYALVIIPVRPLAGKLLDKRTDNTVIYPTLAVYALGFVLLSRAGSGPVLLLSALCVGIGYGVSLSGGHAIAVKYTTPDRFALAVATFYACGDLGVGVGPALLGMLQPPFGYRGMYLSLVLVVLLGGICYTAFHGRGRGRTQ